MDPAISTRGGVRTPTSPTVMGSREFRRCLARFSTGVTVVTYQDEEGPRGATVNSFTSVSMDPPLVLLSLTRKAQACSALVDRPFAVNVLRSDQMDVAFQFAGRMQPRLRIGWESVVVDGDSPDDSSVDRPTVPVLAGSVAVFVCRPWRQYDGGDHILHLGEVIGADARPGDPLVFTDGHFMTTGLPLFDGPLVQSLDGRPVPKWLGAVHRLHTVADAG